MSDEGEGGEAEMLLEGLLTRLDDKLDELQAANRLSKPQLEEQLVGGGFDDGRPAPPATPGCGSRLPLSQAVKDLTCQWSEGFLALAREGCPSSMYIVAQMAMAPKGYGSIEPNRMAGLAWLFQASDHGDLEARGYARRVAANEFYEHLAKKDLGEYKANDAEALEEAIAKWTIKDKELEAEEKRVMEEMAAENPD